MPLMGVPGLILISILMQNKFMLQKKVSYDFYTLFLMIYP
jgi:hypothetical protein